MIIKTCNPTFSLMFIVLCSFFQRLGSQERENSMKRLSCVPALTYGREDSQPRTSANLMRKWNSMDLKSKG